MATAPMIQPNPEFTEQLIESGAGDLKKCFQCANCSVACEIAPDDRPFPRKEMLWAQWGLKEYLVSDPDIWLCHNCSQCSLDCPRGARPGDVLNALREMTIRNYAVPQFLARWMREPAFLPLLVLAPALLLSLALLLRNPVESWLGIAPHAGEGMQYASLFPHWLLIVFFTGLLTLSLALLGLGLLRFWKAIRESDRRWKREPQRPLASAVKGVFRDLALHRRFSACPAGDTRCRLHLGIFYGFAALFLVSAWAVVLLYLLNPLLADPLQYPFSVWNPAKILANLGAVALVGGCLIAFAARVREEARFGKSSAYDWFFLSVLLALGLTGIAAEIARFGEWPIVGYPIYFIHLIFAFMLLVYLPYSKAAHAFYRLLAMIHAEWMGRTVPRGTNSRI